MEKTLSEGPPTAPALHLAITEVYRERVARLHAELKRPDVRAEATEILRPLIEEIRLVPEYGKLEIELAGDIAEILALAPKDKRPTGDAGRAPVSLAAGTHNHLYRTLVRTPPPHI